MSSDTNSLYERLGGYNAIAAVATDLLSRLRADPQLGRFWAHRGEDGITREKQLLVDFLCANAGGPMYYRGRDRCGAERAACLLHSPRNGITENGRIGFKPPACKGLCTGLSESASM